MGNRSKDYGGFSWRLCWATCQRVESARNGELLHHSTGHPRDCTCGFPGRKTRVAKQARDAGSQSKGSLWTGTRRSRCRSESMFSTQTIYWHPTSAMRYLTPNRYVMLRRTVTNCVLGRPVDQWQTRRQSSLLPPSETPPMARPNRPGYTVRVLRNVWDGSQLTVGPSARLQSRLGRYHLS